jgi:hypothetical protein
MPFSTDPYECIQIVHSELRNATRRSVSILLGYPRGDEKPCFAPQRGGGGLRYLLASGAISTYTPRYSMHYSKLCGFWEGQ